MVWEKMRLKSSLICMSTYSVSEGISWRNINWYDISWRNIDPNNFGRNPQKCRHIVYRRVFHGEISIDTIFHGEISIRIISGEIPKNRRYLVIYQRFFPIYQMVNAGQQRSNALQCLKNALFLCWGDSNPLVWGSTKLPLGPACPLFNIMQ